MLHGSRRSCDQENPLRGVGLPLRRCVRVEKPVIVFRRRNHRSEESRARAGLGPKVDGSAIGAAGAHDTLAALRGGIRSNLATIPHVY